MATFPTTLSRSPGWKGFTEELSKSTVQVASHASGAPLLLKLFTFDGIIFKHRLNLVSQADKETVMTFYETNKDIPFDWVNEQDDDTTYEVIFLQPPKYQLDRIKDRWRIDFLFKQYSPL